MTAGLPRALAAEAIGVFALVSGALVAALSLHASLGDEARFPGRR